MPRLFYGNFDFEESLASPGRQRSQVVVRILAELASVWMAVVEPGDLLWCPQPIPTDFLEGLTNQGFPQVAAVSDLGQIPTGCELIPWGWTAEALSWAETVGAHTETPPLEAVCAVNSRRFAWEQEQQRDLLLPGSRVVTEWHDLIDAIELLRSLSMASVVKSEFSQAGRDRFLSTGLDGGRRNELEAWARPRVEEGRTLFVEPLLDAQAEAGIQLTVSKEGHVSCDGIMNATYRSGAFAVGNFSLTPDERSRWDDAVAIAIDVGRAAAGLGYFGPLGVDAMQYRDDEGITQLRAIQDVNARWTMGRLSLGHRRLLRSSEQGRWLMGRSVAELDYSKTAEFRRRRIIETSPRQVGGHPVRLRSCVVIERSS